jgi:sterol desaturase/sphingolipid hydroxylase (fatty acid hydroxylase superfamily)
MINTDFTYSFLNDEPYWLVGSVLILLFALLYGSLSSGLYLLFNWSTKKGITEKVATFKLFKNQIRFEIINSIISIIIFGLYGLLIVFCYRNNIVSLSFLNDYKILIDLLTLAVWNEVHFYISHKSLHTKLLVGIHKTHHKSVVVTPFSTYSFHPIEAIILGSVMILPMFLIEFELIALIIFPIYHLFLNTLGHSNVRLTKKSGGLKSLEISTQHNNHHTKYNSNFGFASSIIDRIMQTYYKIKKRTKTNNHTTTTH